MTIGWLTLTGKMAMAASEFSISVASGLTAVGMVREEEADNTIAMMVCITDSHCAIEPWSKGPQVNV